MGGRSGRRDTAICRPGLLLSLITPSLPYSLRYFLFLNCPFFSFQIGYLSKFVSTPKGKLPLGDRKPSSAGFWKEICLSTPIYSVPHTYNRSVPPYRLALVGTKEGQRPTSSRVGGYEGTVEIPILLPSGASPGFLTGPASGKCFYVQLYKSCDSIRIGPGQLARIHRVMLYWPSSII